MPEFIQSSFAKGEISPDLYGRVDTALYSTTLRKAKNVIIRAFGGASNRQGFQFIGPVKDHTKAVRLKRFEFNVESMYVLEFGHLYMRVLTDDGHVLEAGKVITGATQANPCVITSVAHGYANGDEVEISGVVGMTQLNGLRFVVAGVTANTFQIKNQVTGELINSVGYTAYVSGGVSSRVYTLVTPYQEADLFQLKFAQSADVMTITHNLYTVGELTRTAHDNWTLTEPIFAPTQAFPTGVAVAAGGGTATQAYAVTAIAGEAFAANAFEESLTGTKATGVNITGATQANPCVVTAVAHGFLSGDEVHIQGIVGMTQLNGRRFIVEGVTANTFQLTDQATGANINSTSYTAYSSGGTVSQVFVRITTSAVPPNNTISWTAAAGALRYAVYKQVNGIFGLIGETELNTFLDNNITPNLSFSPPHARNPFLLAGDTPGAVSYYEQRRVFGGSLNRPDTSFYSQVASGNNMTTSFPVQADDAITTTLASDSVNEIRHFVPGNDLIILTSGGEWRVNSGIDSIFSATTLKQKPQSLWGSSHIPPIKSGNTTLFVTANKKGIRSFGYSATLDGYEGADMLLWANHLLETHALKDWTEVRLVDPLNVGVRTDGKIIALTYSSEQQVLAWAVWDTLGEFESVATMRGEDESHGDHLFAVVKRKVNGNTVKYIERLHMHTLTDVRDAFHVDSGLSYDIPVPIQDIGVSNPVTILAAAHGFQNGDEVDLSDILWESNFDSVDNETQPDQLNTKRYIVAGATANTFQLQGVDGTSYKAYVSGGKARKAISVISGLNHLEGRVVQVLADGNVISDVTITNGGFTLATKASRVHAGLKFISDIETPDIEPSQGTLQGKLKKIKKAVVRFRRSRGLFIGPDTNNLKEIKQREFEKIGDPTDLFSGDKEVTFSPSWNTNGRIFMRQRYPLPMNILAVIPDLTVSD